ncbi:hypothetical protein [Schleiferia thermophila]
MPAPTDPQLQEDLDAIRRIVLPYDFEAEIRVFSIEPEEIDIGKEIYLLIISQKIDRATWFYMEYELRKHFKGRFVKTYVVKQINSGLLRIAYDCSVRITECRD